jgi:hypothetical protein
MFYISPSQIEDQPDDKQLTYSEQRVIKAVYNSADSVLAIDVISIFLSKYNAREATIMHCPENIRTDIIDYLESDGILAL